MSAIARSPRAWPSCPRPRRRVWPGQSPLGRSIWFETGADSAPLEALVVGVADDVRYRAIGEGSQDMIYVPAAQRHFGRAMHVVAAPKPGLPEYSLHRVLKRAAARVEPEHAHGEVETIRDRVSAALAGHAFLASVATTFGLLALLLAAAGIFGTFSYLVASRKRDLAIRMAIGSSSRQIYCLVLGEAAVLVAVGAAVGVVASVAASKTAIAAMLLPASTGDASYVAIGLVVCAAGLLAVLPVARVAATSDPQSALRAEG